MYIYIYLLLHTSKYIHILRTTWRDPLYNHPQLNFKKKAGSLKPFPCAKNYAKCFQRYETISLPPFYR